MLGGIFKTKRTYGYQQDLHDFVAARECENEEDVRHRISAFLIHASQTHGLFFVFSYFFWILSYFRYFYLGLALIALFLLWLRFFGIMSKTSPNPMIIMGVGEAMLYLKIFVVIFSNFDVIAQQQESGYVVATGLALIVALQLIWREWSIIKIFNWASTIPRNRRQ